MKRSTFRFIILLAFFALAGIVLTQAYWIQRAWELRRSQFESNVEAALASVAKQVTKSRPSDARLMIPVRKISPFHYIVLTNDVADPNMLSHALRKEFVSRGITRDFEFTLFDCETESVVFSDYIKFKGRGRDYAFQSVNWPKWDKETYYFGVYFPDGDGLVVNDMGIWTFSSIAVLFIIGFFSYTVFEITKQHRLADIQQDFIDTMTHEFKTPLTTINLAAEVIKTKDIALDHTQVAHYADMIHSEVYKLKNQIETILARVTDHGNKQGLKLDHVDVCALLTSIAAGLELSLAKNHATLDIKTDAGLRVLADKTHLQSAIYNLLDNALKYGGEGVHIEITAQQTGKNITIEVQDNGPGIAPQDQRWLFNKFYRTKSAMSGPKGFGLGLFYVRNVMRWHGGKVGFLSEVGKGTTIRLILPLVGVKPTH